LGTLPVATTTAARAQQLVADAHAALALQAATAAHERDRVLVEPRDLHRVVEVVDDLVAAGQQRLDVERAGDRLAHAGHPPRLGEQLGRPQQRLGRHARPERALAADEPVLDHRRRVPPVGQPPGDDLARRARADDDDVELPLPHVRMGAYAAGGTSRRLVTVTRRGAGGWSGGAEQHQQATASAAGMRLLRCA
jgi:hypothetical protein